MGVPVPDEPLPPTTNCGVNKPLTWPFTPAGEGRPPSEGGRAEPESIDMPRL